MKRNALEWSENDTASIDARFRSLLEVSLVLNSSLRLDEVLERVMQKAMEVMEAEAGSVWLLEKDSIIPYIAGGPRADALKGLRLPKGKGIAGKVIDSGQPVLVSDVRNDPHWAAHFDITTGFETRSMMCVPFKTKEKTIGCLQLLNKGIGLFDADDLDLAMAFASQAAVVIDNSRLYTNQRTLFMGLLGALTSALDARDPYTRGHSERVSWYSLIIGRELGMSRDELDKLEETALLHDIGKIGIKDSVLLCKGPLDEDGWAKIKRHPEIGAGILEDLVPEELAEHLKEGTLYHQERYNGTGYPFGVKNEDIPLFARILSVADTFDAITSDRPYRKGRSVEAALEEIERCAGTQLDPKLAEVFVKALREDPGLFKKGEI